MSVQRRTRQPSLLSGLGLERGATPSPVRVEQLGPPLDLEQLVPGERQWELELGFGKGRYLLRRAEQDRDIAFLGVEIVSRYFRLTARRAARRGLDNLVVARSEALYFLSACMPRHFARAVHIYFPDPWPKARHQKRRLFDADTVDLVLGAIEPGGRLFFASDYLEYGEKVAELLEAHPAVVVRRLEEWPEGPRTNYEAKFVTEGRPIIRLECLISTSDDERLLHPEGRSQLLVGPPCWSVTRGEPGARR